MRLGISLLFLLLFSISPRAEETVKIAYPATTYTTMPVVVALGEGFFNQENLNLQLIQIRPNISITAVLAGEVDFTTTQGSIVRAAARGAPIKSVAVIADRPVYFLVARPGLTSVESLKAKDKKIIGVNSLGGSVHMITKEVLARHGINPDKDVAIEYRREPPEEANLQADLAAPAPRGLRSRKCPWAAWRSARCTPRACRRSPRSREPPMPQPVRATDARGRAGGHLFGFAHYQHAYYRVDSYCHTFNTRIFGPPQPIAGAGQAPKLL